MIFVATCNTPEETVAFYCLLTDFVDIPQSSPGKLILDGRWHHNSIYLRSSHQSVFYEHET